MRIRGTTLLAIVLAVGFGQMAGCQPAGRQNGDGQEAAGNRDAVEAPMPIEDGVSAGKSDGSTSSAGVNVDIGGGEGVDVDVDLPSDDSTNTRGKDGNGVQVDVGDGAVDVEVGAESGTKP